MITLDLLEAALFLRMHPEEVRRRAKIGLIPGAKPGKSWVFLQEDLVKYLRALYAPERQALQVIPKKEDFSCHFLNAAVSGGLALPLQRESELDVLLKQKISLKHRSSTII